jgi:hypothetical protein
VSTLASNESKSGSESRVRKIFEWLPFVGALLLLLLTTFADLIPHLDSVLPASRVGLYVTIAFAALFGFVIKLQDKVSDLAQSIDRSTEAQLLVRDASALPIQRMTLVGAFEVAATSVSGTKEIRVFANTSRLISQQIQLPFATTEMKLLVAGPDPGRDPSLYSEIRASVLYTWVARVRSQVISELAVRQYDFYPTEWFVIFDDRLMIYGAYRYDDHAIGRVAVSEAAFVVKNVNEGSRFIESRSDAFDRLFAAAESSFGAGEFEGLYRRSQSEGVERRRPSGAWEDLTPVSTPE